MNVLQISPVSANPPDSGGAHRIHGLMSNRRDDDSVLRWVGQSASLETPWSDESLSRIESGYYEYVRTSFPRAVVRGGIARFLRGLVDPPATSVLVDSAVLAFDTTAMLQRQIEIADVVQVEYPWMFPYISRLVDDDQLLVYSSHNDEVEYHSYLREHRADRIILRGIKRLEQYAVETADLVVVVSERDAESYRGRGFDIGEYHVAPNCPPRIPDHSTLIPNRPDTVEATDPVAVFVGHHTELNVNAVENVLGIAPSCQEVEFCIIGTVCEAFSEREIPSNVHFLGFVEDLGPLLAGADLALNPITSGSGSNLKLAEYLAFGVPTISTPFGARGHPVKGGKHLCLAEIDEFPAKIKELLRSDAKLDRLTENATNLLDEGYRWANVSADLFRRYEKML